MTSSVLRTLTADQHRPLKRITGTEASSTRGWLERLARNRVGVVIDPRGDARGRCERPLQRLPVSEKCFQVLLAIGAGPTLSCVDLSTRYFPRTRQGITGFTAQHLRDAVRSLQGALSV